MTDRVGKEVIIKVTTDLDNQGEFYTDSNGLDLMYRKVDWRSDFEIEKGSVAGNYYPVNAIIGLKEKSTKTFLDAYPKELYLVNDRPQGGSSLEKGSLELMIHRAVLHDDSRGVGEPLNELDAEGKPLKVRVRHSLVFGDVEKARELQQKNDS